MNNKFSFLLIFPLLLTSCNNNTLFGYDNSDKNKMNTNLFYRNVGMVQAADPHVIKYDNKYYLYATNANENADCSYLQCWSSVNLTDWTNEGICYQPERTNWCIDGLWAPEVIERNGTFYLYYSGWSLKSGMHELGVAKSSSPTGPFVDFRGFNDNGEYIGEKDAPIRISTDGFSYDAAIDSSPFIDKDGTPYLYFSQDQHRDDDVGVRVSTIYVAKMNSDMVSIQENTLTKLISPSLPWELESGSTNMWNEAPFMYEKDGIYYLFYSANYYMDRAYCLGVATSSSPMGPFVKKESPLLKTQDYWDYITGTGHCSIFSSADDKETFITYHSHKDTIIGGGERTIKYDRIIFDNGNVYVNGPTISPQLLPSGSSEYFNIANEATIKINNQRNVNMNDGYINAYEDKLENEFNVSSKEAIIEIEFEDKKDIRAIMLYDSANYRYALPKIDSITINDKSVYNVSISKEYYDNIDSMFKIPCSAFIYEFDEIVSDKITIKLSSKQNIYLNEIVVVGK